MRAPFFPIGILAAILAQPCAQADPAAPNGSVEGDAKKFGFERPLNLQWLPNDARQWAQYGKSVLVTDLRQVAPASALAEGKREKGKWKVLPFETASFRGHALSIYGRTEPPPVRLPVNATGWHAVYVGICTVSGGLDATQSNGLRVRLASAPVYRRIANNLKLLPARRDTIQEQFLTVANLQAGESIDLAPMPFAPATVAYVRLVPITDHERAAWEKEKSDPTFRNTIATFDGHSWIWPYRPRTKEHLLETFEGFRGTDFAKWWFQVLGADLVFYPSKIGTIPGEGTVDFSRWEHEEFTRSAQALVANGVNALKVARDAAREQGSEFHVMIRPQGWGASIPWEETFNSKFYHAHPDWRCVDREGRQAMHMSYAVPEVRQRVLDILREAVEMCDPEGVGLLFVRGMPLMLWEPAFCERFSAEFGADAKAVNDDDARIHALRGRIMNEFFSDLRSMLDRLAKAKNGRRYTISVATFSEKKSNDRFGLDVATWIKEKLIDELAIAYHAHHTGFVPPNVDYYREVVKSSQTKVYPFVLAWKTGPPASLCQEVLKYYQKGAAGIAVWDPVVERGYAKDSYEGNPVDLLGYLGHQELVAYWAKNGMPKPNAFPLLKLGDNEYSKWFPNTGY